MYVSRHFHAERTFCAIAMQQSRIWLVYLTWTTSLLLSDPEGSYWHRTPTRARPITPIISLNDVKCMPRMRVRQDEKAANRFLIVSGMVEPNGFEPMTSCLQSRRSTN